MKLTVSRQFIFFSNIFLVLNGIWVDGGSSDGNVIDVGGHSGEVKMTLMPETIGGTDHCKIGKWILSCQ